MCVKQVSSIFSGASKIKFHYCLLPRTRSSFLQKLASRDFIDACKLPASCLLHAALLTLLRMKETLSCGSYLTYKIHYWV